MAEREMNRSMFITPMLCVSYIAIQEQRSQLKPLNINFNPSSLETAEGAGMRLKQQLE